MTIKYVNFWADNNRIFDEILSYLFKPYGMDTSKICMVSCFGPTSNILKLSEDHINIFYTGENNVDRFQKFNDDLIAPHVDIILNFFDATTKSVRFPIWMIYWKFWKDGLFSVNKQGPRKLAATCVASHDTHNTRLPLIQDVLSKGIPVITTLKFNGSVAGLSQIKIGPSAEDKKLFIQEYMFNICPENTLRDGYVTEKIFQAIEAGCLPIYQGCRFLELNILNHHRILSKPPEGNTAALELINIFNRNPWAEDAIYYVYLYYIRLLCKVKAIYESKFNHGKSIKYNVPEEQVMMYACRSSDQITNMLKTHWKQHATLFDPFPVFQVTEKDTTEVYDVCECYERGWLATNTIKFIPPDV